MQVYDSHTVPFVFALEVFNPGHLTPHHIHPDGHELFYILSGEGEVRHALTKFLAVTGCIARCVQPKSGNAHAAWISY